MHPLVKPLAEYHNTDLISVWKAYRSKTSVHGVISPYALDVAAVLTAFGSLEKAGAALGVEVTEKTLLEYTPKVLNAVPYHKWTSTRWLIRTRFEVEQRRGMAKGFFGASQEHNRRSATRYAVTHLATGLLVSHAPSIRSARRLINALNALDGDLGSCTPTNELMGQMYNTYL